MAINARQRIKEIWDSKPVRNGLWLYVLQIVNTAMPLITLPYITRVLGASQYGIFSSALNLVCYFQVIVEYGFNLSAARKVSIATDNAEISRIYTCVMVSKLLLCGVTFFLMILMMFVFDVDHVQMICMLILYLMVLGAAMQQTWLFQGLQVMKYITIVSLISRMISLGLIFSLVRRAEQVYLYCWLYSLVFLLMGIFSLLVVNMRLGIYCQNFMLKDLLTEIKDGWYLFTTSAMTSIFSGIGVTVLAFTSTHQNVGIYSAIQKIPVMMSMLYAPIGIAIFPNLGKYFLESFEIGVSKVKKISKYVIICVIFISLLIILNSRFLIFKLYGSEYASHSRLLIPLIGWMALSILNNLLGVQILVASGHQREYSVSFRLGVFAMIFLNVCLGASGSMVNVALAAMVAEFVLTAALMYQINKIIESLKRSLKSDMA